MILIIKNLVEYINGTSAKFKKGVFIVVIIQGYNKVRALNLAKSRNRKYECERFAKMTNLHYLILDGCDVSGNFDKVSKELRWLQWRNMPLIHLPRMWNFLNLVTLDFSNSPGLASIWTESDSATEVHYSTF